MSSTEAFTFKFEIKVQELLLKYNALNAVECQRCGMSHPVGVTHLEEQQWY